MTVGSSAPSLPPQPTAHGRLATLGGHLARLGAALDGAVGSYNSAVGSLESRVLVTARSMASLGVVDETAGDDAGLPAPRLVTSATRPLSAPELVASADGGLATLATDVPRAGATP